MQRVRGLCHTEFKNLKHPIVKLDQQILCVKQNDLYVFTFNIIVNLPVAKF